MADTNILLNKIDALRSSLKALRGYLDYDLKSKRLAEISKELENPSNWDNIQKRQALGKEQTQLETFIKQIDNLESCLKDSKDLLQLAIIENDDKTILEIEEDTIKLSSQIDTLEFQRIFSGPMDQYNAYLDIQAGSGGTEAQDWTEMLLRMYLRFGDQHYFKTQLLEVSPGEVAGIKSATIKLTGDYVYGWLRTESGVHRLVRKSPFDANHKRHTSFASVFVYPEIDEDIKIEINPADLRIDTYRAQGAGGQHVNKTDSAIRIKHNPTGIIVQCQSERSQHQNRAQAMKQLRSRLYELELKKQEDKRSALEASKLDITWGSQIRSYVLDDSRIKDLRTGTETRNTQKVLDGNLDIFIKENLRMK
ncbi:MAG: peptide chain release factor 2 [Coxiellaceae bacterium]|nr:peptide chain release factor 2 [Coxiellaceae bacterium]